MDTDGTLHMIRTMTGVGAHFSAAHRDLNTGQLHGHTWEVTAWFSNTVYSALTLRAGLEALLNEKFDHKELPKELSWAEPIAACILEALGTTCIRVQVDRNIDKLHAIAERA